MGIMSPTPVPTRTLNIRNRGIAKKLGTKGKREQKRIGIAMALLLALAAATCDALSLITIGVSNYLLFWVPWLFALYFRSKGIRKGWLCFLAGLIEFIPIINLLNLQIIYVLAIIVSNWSTTARPKEASPPMPASDVHMLQNAA